MARTGVSTLEQFEAIVRKMRDLGVASWADSPVGSIVLGVEPPAKLKKAEKDPKAERRVYYAEVFGRPVSDAELEKLP